ncbi:uncharacterized protein CBL_01611 [Carabus blaptoides fortunei]
MLFICYFDNTYIKFKKMKAKADTLQELQKDGRIFSTIFYYTVLIILGPVLIFFGSKIIILDGFLGLSNTATPGFIDLQINGGFGTDFSFNTNTIQDGVKLVAKGLLSHGVTSFCPTVVTSPPDVYLKVLPHIPKNPGGLDGATILGVHVEGPFINIEKKGAHPPQCIQGFDNGIQTVLDAYGSMDNVKIITLAPELKNALPVIQELSKKNIVVSVGHSMGNLCDGEAAVQHGATFITHLFNAMLPFHHRDPGLVGLLTSDNIPEGKTVYFGIISDGIHTHPAALRIAYRAHSQGLVLVTDAISAMGLEEGTHHIGQMAIEVRNGRAFVAGTNTLCGSIATMNQCVQLFKKATGCSTEYALEAASLHPAKVLVKYTELPIAKVKLALCVLIKQGFVIFKPWKNEVNAEYELVSEKVLLILRYPKIIDKKHRVDTITMSLKVQGAPEEQLLDIEDMITPPEKEMLEKIGKVMKNLNLAELEIDDTIFLFQLFCAYNKNE